MAARGHHSICMIMCVWLCTTYNNVTLICRLDDTAGGIDP